MTLRFFYKTKESEPILEIIKYVFLMWYVWFQSRNVYTYTAAMSQKAILKEHNYKIVRGGFIWIRDTLILSYSTLTVDNTLPCIL